LNPLVFDRGGAPLRHWPQAGIRTRYFPIRGKYLRLRRCGLGDRQLGDGRALSEGP
jgi:hypothetical protein